MTLFDKDKLSHLNYARKKAIESGISVRPENRLNSFSKISKETPPRRGTVISNLLLKK